ncbi:MAG: hypothetical protein Q7S78_01965 [Candidatus Azambacteria bacterium]|nr:hypothetical protein [Candidatus Azambacteria bacterium]
MIKCFGKKSAIIVAITLILILAMPKPALAQLATAEVNPLVWLFNIFSSSTGNVTAGATTAQVGETLFEWAAKIAVQALKKQLLDMIVDQIVSWIQGGGDPKFITDWPGFFRDAVDQAGGKFIQKIGLSQLCSPFKPLLGAGFIPIPTFTDRTSCTLSKIGVNIDAFLKDFEQGGWIAWREMVLKPQNNIYGAYALAWDQYEIEKSAAAKSAAAEAQAGKGFLSVKKCIEWSAEGLQACMDQGGTSWEDCQKVACIKEKDVTPGSVVGDMASKAVGADIDFIVNADDLAAYVGAITNAVLNRMFAEGLSGIKTSLFSEGSSGGGGGAATAQAQCAQLLGTAAYNDCISAVQIGKDMREFQKDTLLSMIDEELKYRSQLLGAKQATLAILNQSIGVLTELGNCQHYTPPSEFPELVKIQGVASTTVDQVIKTQSDIVALQVKQQEVKAVTDLTQIPALFANISTNVKPAQTYSLVLAAQDETVQKQQELSNYQQQLNTCQTTN